MKAAERQASGAGRCIGDAFNVSARSPVAWKPVAAAVFTAAEAEALPDGWTTASMTTPLSGKPGDVIVFLNLPYQFDFAEGGTPLRDTAVWWGAHGHLPQSGEGVPNADLYAAFYASGPGLRHGTPRYVRAIDLAPTIAYLLGFPAPSKAQGRVLTEILFEHGPARRDRGWRWAWSAGGIEAQRPASAARWSAALFSARKRAGCTRGWARACLRHLD